jgi:hypothetical protein
MTILGDWNWYEPRFGIRRSRRRAVTRPAAQAEPARLRS